MGADRQIASSGPLLALCFQNQILVIKTLSWHQFLPFLPADFIWLQGRVLTGEVSHVTDVPGGEVIWQLPWEGLLAAELAWHQQQPGMPPDGILLHRKRRGGRENSLIHDVRCR